MNNDWLLISQKNELANVLNTNELSEKFGLTLTSQDAELILAERKKSLIEQRRVEFGDNIIQKLIYEFCDSQYVDRNSYVETLIRLQEIFYQFKNETEDMITDDELLHVMRDMFDEVCYGDLNYLAGSCLEAFSQAIKEGYRGYQYTDGRGEAKKFSELTDWHYQLFLEILERN